MARIVTVYTQDPRARDWEHRELIPNSMSYVRWIRITEELANLGYQVDIALPDKIADGPHRFIDDKVKTVALSQVRWNDYDVIKTVFHLGFETLEAYGGTDHPFIISKLGTVVGSVDMPGIYFYGKIRKDLYATQQKINRTSRYITLLTESAQKLWEECYGRQENMLIVPGATENSIPQSNGNPYQNENRKICIFSGNVYTQDSQPEANDVLVEKLNQLGKLLSNSNVKLCLLGPGDVSRLDQRYVAYLGSVNYQDSWDYVYHADSGLVVSAGSFQHNNESTKIYYYLRCGLPMVSESGFPNDYVVRDSQLGSVVESENMELMAQKIIETANRQDWDREYAKDYILNNHTWGKRVELYDEIIRTNLKMHETEAMPFN